MDQELIAYLDEHFRGIDERFRETSQQIQDLRQETSRRFDEVHATVRQTDVKVEDLRGKIELVAEGVAMVDEKLEIFRQEVAREFEETRAFNRSSYRKLDRRVKDLEARAS
jgi:methyl-accepting chemotaxis protein